MHYAFTQILRYFYAACCWHESGHSALPDMSGLVDQSGASVWKRGTGAVRLLSLSVWLRYDYGVQPHKRKQPCAEPADPQHTYTLGNKNRIYLFGGFEIREC
ncbi:NIPSNAP domain containing protein [Trichinella spiralis]|uniref:NIPSNAP domain containing protein n=1 Tax=Trichinella spiralis TaxID=6334 RepID=UPI0001EFC6A1|nr:NIPSNAP domain containing protein [Trichinella spiralis]